MNGAPLFPCTLGSTTFDNFLSFSLFAKTLFPFGRFAWQHTQVVICAILRGPQARVIKLSSFFLFVTMYQIFFWLLLIKRCPLPTKVRSFALNFMGTGSSNENNVGDSEFAWWRGAAVYEWVHTCLRQIYNLNFPFTFQSTLGKFLPHSGTEFMQF